MHRPHEVPQARVVFQNCLVHEMRQIDMVKGAEITVTGIAAKEERAAMAREQKFEISETGMKDRKAGLA